MTNSDSDKRHRAPINLFYFRLLIHSVLVSFMYKPGEHAVLFANFAFSIGNDEHISA